MELKVIEREAKILEKAKELFFFFGVKTITMADLSKNLKISKKTLYSYYKNKGEMINLIMGNLLTKQSEELLNIKGNAKNAIEEVIQHAKLSYSTFKDLKPNAVLELEKSFPKLAEKFSNRQRGYMLSSIKENLERGKKEGVYRNDLDVAFTAQLRLNQLTSAFDEQAFSPLTYNIRNIIDKLTAFYLNAICVEESKILITTNKTDNK